MGSFSTTAEPKAALLQAKKKRQKKENKRLHHGRVVSAKSCRPSSNPCNNTMLRWRRFLSPLKAGLSHPFSLLHRDDGPKRHPGAGQVLRQGLGSETNSHDHPGSQIHGQPSSSPSHLPRCRHLCRFHRPGFPNGAKICLPGCGQPGYSIRRRGQGLHWVDRHHHRLSVDLVRHPAAELHGCKQVRNQRSLLVRGGRHHPDHHLLHPLHHAQDESPRCKDFPPTVKDDFESWYNLDSLGESSQSTRSQEQRSVGEERRRGRSRSKDKGWLRRREDRSRSRERNRSRSKERRRNWSKERSRRRSQSRDGRWSRDQRSRSRERWRGNMSRSGDRRRDEAQRESTSEDELGVEGASGERTPSPSSCARLPPHLLGGWTVLPD